MKVLSFLPSSASRALRVGQTTNPKLYGGNLVHALRMEYGFLEVPTKLAEYDFKSGVRFLGGIHEGHGIDLEILENGVRAYSSGGTDACDKFLDSLVKFAAELGMELSEASHIRIYVSVLELEFNGDFASIFSKLSAVGSLIGSLISEYGGPNEGYQGAGLTMMGRLSATAPEPFKLERRAETDFKSNVFFSSAPLAFKDHVTVLNEIERALL